MLEKLFLVIFIFGIISFTTAWAAEPIKITISDKMNLVNFDGKWTNSTEWKRSSQNKIVDNDSNNIVQLRTAHQDNFIYAMIDFVSDEKPEKGKDFAIICLDTQNDKTINSNENDYCFKIFLDESDVTVLQGTVDDSNDFQEMEFIEGIIGVGTTSDEFDRYSKVPHASYEFRIPTDLVGRSNIYGIFVGAYDSDSDTMVTWPEEINVDSKTIPSPSEWGEIISPDKSLPEFDLPFVILFSSFAAIIYLTKKYQVTKRNDKEIR